jgi:hypothetical protein
MRPLALLLLLTGCSPPPPETAIAEADFDAPPRAIAARVAATTLTLDALVARAGDGFVLHGRATRDLDGAEMRSCGDAGGSIAQASPRTFDARWPKAASLAGNPAPTLVLSAGGTPIAARVSVRPRVVRAVGAALRVENELQPVLDDGQIRYRLRGVNAGADNFERLLGGDELEALAGSDRDLSLTFTLDSGQVEVERIWIALAVKRLELTTDDPVEPACEIE